MSDDDVRCGILSFRESVNPNSAAIGRFSLRYKVRLPSTGERRLISLSTRSSESVLAIRDQCYIANPERKHVMPSTPRRTSRPSSISRYSVNSSARPKKWNPVCFEPIRPAACSRR